MERLIIQSHKVELIFSDPSDWEIGAMGRCNTVKQTIAINNSMPKDSQNSTIIHEVVHYISDLYGMSLSEEQVSTLSICWFDFLKTNPDFMQELCYDD